MRRVPFTLSFKLPLLVALAVALTALVGSVAAIVIGHRALRADALEEVGDRVDVYASAIKTYVDNARSVLETTATSSSTQRLSLDRSQARLILDNARVFEYVMLLRPDGLVDLLEPRALERQLSHRDLSFHRWYRDVVATGGTVVSDLHISPATQRPTVIIATPVRSLAGDAVGIGEVTGIWAGAIELAELSRLGRGASGTKTTPGYGYVTDRRGLIIAHQGRASYVQNQTDFSAVPTVRAALAGQRGAVEFLDPIEGEENIGGYRPIEGLGWAAAYVVPVTHAFAPIGSLTRGIVASSVALAVVMGGVGVMVAQRIVRPLRRLTTAARGISAGNYGNRIETRTGDEIEHLAEAFNQMAVKLAEKESQLHLRAEELQAANKELEAFSYSVSHDLRAPLRAMDGFSRILLEEEQALSTSSRRYLGLVRDNAVQMGHLVDDLLSFSRLSRQSLKRAQVEPASLVAHVLEDLKAEHDGRRVEIVVGDLPACMADHSLLKQVWSNLLANAIKFTQRRDFARIDVGYREHDGEHAYFVKDNGVGFEMRYADKLFGVFQRLHRAEEYEGTGVGLAIVQRIVHRHGGRVWAEAEEGKGATFHFTLGRRTSAPGEDGR